MILLRLRGGLGNQLFQYAAGQALAFHHHTSFKLDLYFYRTHNNRKFELENFNIPIEIATRDEVWAFTGGNPIKRFINKRENYLRCPAVFVQPHYHYYDDYFQLPGNLYLSGYFQSEKYFRQIGEQIRDWYSIKKPLDQVNAGLVEEMKSSVSVAIHVRRGDYANQYASFFGTVPQEYYLKAIEVMHSRVSNPKFFVFSDDVSWCKQNLPIPQATFVDHNTGANSYKDLWLMSNCRHNIIANSSFSWWGAWLNRNATKVIIAPKGWFREPYFSGKAPVYPARIYNTKDLIPEGWTLL